jgi:hypothetical protein
VILHPSHPVEKDTVESVYTGVLESSLVTAFPTVCEKKCAK